MADSAGKRLMRFILYVGQETAIARELAFNAGIDEVLSSPKWLRLVRRVDASQLSREERHHLYLYSIYPATRKSYGVRKVFGTRSNPARSFAKEVPALV